MGQNCTCDAHVVCTLLIGEQMRDRVTSQVDLLAGTLDYWLRKIKGQCSERLNKALEICDNRRALFIETD